MSRRRHGPVVRVLGLHAVAPGSNPILTSGQDLFPVVTDSTLPRVVKMVASHHVSVKFSSFRLLKRGVSVN